MSTSSKWWRWAHTLPAYAPEWTCARFRWIVREHSRRMLPRLDLTPEQAADYLDFYGIEVSP